MSFYKETEFKSNGYNGIVIFGSHGYRCGYVGVPEGHPLFKKKYNEPCSCLPYKYVENITQGKREILPWLKAKEQLQTSGVFPDAYFDVHGSITYSDFFPECSNPGDTRWYFGFDCGHAGDGNDYDTAVKYGLINKEYRDRMREYPIDGVHRTLEYCIEECKSLAAQLAEVEKKSRLHDSQ